MRFFAVAASALLANTALAAPSVEKRTDSVHVQWQGAADAVADQYVAVDSVSYPPNADFSVSHIAVLDNRPSVTCVATGVDGSFTTVSGGQTIDVGPPQLQISIICSVGPK